MVRSLGRRTFIWIAEAKDEVWKPLGESCVLTKLPSWRNHLSLGAEGPSSGSSTPGSS